MHEDIKNWLIAIIIGIMPAAFNVLGINEKLQNEIFFVLLSISISYLVLSAVARNRQVGDFRAGMEELRQLLHEATRQRDSANLLVAKLSDLSKFSPLIQSTAGYALNQALAECDIPPGAKSLEIRGRGLAYRSYAEFWHYLSEYQHDHRDRRCIVRVTHSSDMAVWKDDGVERINNLQRKFSTSGSIFRIFINRDSAHTHTDEYIGAIRRLRNNKVRCAYLTLQQINGYGTSKWISDFCIVEGPYVTARWGIDRDNKISSLKLDEDRRAYDANLSDWETLLEVLSVADYTSENAAHAKYLQESRDEFIRELNAAVSLNVGGKRQLPKASSH